MVLRIEKTTKKDAGLILKFIQDLAVYEKLAHEAVATLDDIENTLFGEKAYAECVIAYDDGAAVGFALFFHNYSTFLGKPGLYLEDLFVKPEHRGKGYGKALLSHLAKLALARNCGRLEWSVLNWNTPAIDFYKSIGAQPMDGWTVNRMDVPAMKNLIKM